MPRKNQGEKNFHKGYTPPVDDRTDVQRRRKKPEVSPNVLKAEPSGRGRREEGFKPGDRERAAQAEDERNQSALERLRNNQDLSGLVFEGTPTTKKWTEAYLEKVRRGLRSNKTGSLEGASRFLDEAVLSENIARDTNRLLTGGLGDKVLEEDYDRRKTRPFNAKTVAGQLSCSRAQAADLVAFVNLFEDKYDIGRVIDCVNRKSFEHLGKMDVKKEDAEMLAKLFTDEVQLGEVEEVLFERVAPLLGKHMTVEGLFQFAKHNTMFGHTISQESFKKYFNTPKRKVACQEFLAEEARAAFAQKKPEDVQLFFRVALGKIKDYEYIFGQLTREEFEKMFPNWQKLENEWMLKDLQEKYGLARPTSTEIARQGTGALTAPDRSSGDSAGGAEKVSPKVKYVKERQLITERQHPRALTRPDNYLVAFAEEPEKPMPTALVKVRSASESAVGRVRPERPTLAPDQETTVFIPLNRDESVYRGEIENGLTEMKAEVDMGKRVTIFLDKVWPKFLISRADQVESSALDQKVQEAVNLLDASVRQSFLELINLSQDVKTNAVEIERVAKDLRANTDLHEHGCYVNTEIAHRLRLNMGETSEPVDLLISISFKAGRIAEYQIQGQRADIIYLGPRIDHIDEDLGAAGLRYNGDGHSVVVTEAIWNHVNSIIIPYLRDKTEFLVSEGKTMHRINDLIRDALRRELGINPDAQQCVKIAENSFESTAAHELQHATDEIMGHDDSVTRPIEKRVRQEVKAYLASIVRDNETKANPATPLTDVVKIVTLYIDQRENPFARLSDLAGIYEKASKRILVLLAGRLNCEGVDEEFLTKKHLEGSARVLESAMKLSGQELRNLAREIIAQVVAEEPVPAKRRSATRDSGASGPIRPVEIRTPGGATDTVDKKPAKKEKLAPPDLTAGPRVSLLDKFKQGWAKFTRNSKQPVEAVSPILQLEKAPDEGNLLPAPPADQARLKSALNKLKAWSGLDDFSVIARSMGRQVRTVELALIAAFLANAVDNPSGAEKVKAEDLKAPDGGIESFDESLAGVMEMREDVASMRRGIWGYAERQAKRLGISSDQADEDAVRRLWDAMMKRVKVSGEFGIGERLTTEVVDKWSTGLSVPEAEVLVQFLRAEFPDEKIVEILSAGK